jgi:hypothetical protein
VFVEAGEGILVRRGKGGRRREVGMDAWAWDELRPWLTRRLELPIAEIIDTVRGRRAPMIP